MRDFGYHERGRAITEAQAEIHAAFPHVVNRNDRGDPKTKRWLDAIDRFNVAYARVYPDQLCELENGIRPISDVDTGVILNFLEADPIFFRSGYMKERLLPQIKRRSLNEREKARLRAAILRVVQQQPRREFIHHCRVARSVDDEEFRQNLKSLQASSDVVTARQARWMLAALEPNWNWRRDRGGPFY